MDWPRRSIWRRIVWARTSLRFWRERRGGYPRHPLYEEPSWWSDFERDFSSHIAAQARPDVPARHAGRVVETLQQIERDDGHLPLLLLTVTDCRGCLLHAVTVDPEDYD